MIWFVGFLILGAVLMGIVGYITGYMDGKEDLEIEKDNSRRTDADKPIDFDLWRDR